MGIHLHRIWIKIRSQKNEGMRTLQVQGIGIMLNMKAGVVLLVVVTCISLEKQEQIEVLGIFSICYGDTFNIEEFLWAQALNFSFQFNGSRINYRIVSDCNNSSEEDLWNIISGFYNKPDVILFPITSQFTLSRRGWNYYRINIDEDLDSLFNDYNDTIFKEILYSWNKNLTNDIYKTIAALMNFSSGYPIKIAFSAKPLFKEIQQAIKSSTATCVVQESMFYNDNEGNTFLFQKLAEDPGNVLILGDIDNLISLTEIVKESNHYVFCCLFSLTELGKISNTTSINGSIIIVIENIKTQEKEEFTKYLQELLKSKSNTLDDPLFNKLQDCVLSKTESECSRDYQPYNYSTKCNGSQHHANNYNYSNFSFTGCWEKQLSSTKLSLLLTFSSATAYEYLMWMKGLQIVTPSCKDKPLEDDLILLVNLLKKICLASMPWIPKAYKLLTIDGINLKMIPLDPNDNSYSQITSSSPPCHTTCPNGYSRTMVVKCCYSCTECQANTFAHDSTCKPCGNGTWSSAGSTECKNKTSNYLAYSNAYGITFLTISIIGLILTILVIAVYIKHANTPIVKASGGFIFVCNMVGHICCFFSVLGFLGEPTGWRCLARETVFGISFAICLSSILARSFRILSAFFISTERPSPFQKHFSLCIILIGTLIQVTICVIWVTVDPPKICSIDTQDTHDQTDTICCSNSPYWLIGVIGYLVLLALISCLCAVKSRSLPSNFNDASEIAFSMLAFLAVWMCTIPILATQKYSLTQTVSIVIAILVSSFSCLGFLFFYKCYIMVFKPEKNTSEWIKKSVFEYCQKISGIKNMSSVTDTSESPDNSSNIKNGIRQDKSIEASNSFIEQS